MLSLSFLNQLERRKMVQRMSNQSSFLLFILAASSLTTASDPYKIVIDNVGNFEAQKLDKKLYADPLRPVLNNKLGSSSLDVEVRAPDFSVQKLETSDSRVVTSSVRKVTRQVLQKGTIFTDKFLKI